MADSIDLVQPKHMKRTNLVLDGDLLEEATRISGEKISSATVMRALEDFVRRARARQILELRGHRDRDFAAIARVSTLRQRPP